MILMLNACSENSTKPGTESGTEEDPYVRNTEILFPLKLDNTWIYEVKNTLNGMPLPADNDTMKIKSKDDFDGTTYFGLHSFPFSPVKCISNKNNGAYLFPGIGVEAVIILKYPCTKGESYKVNELEITVESTSESIQAAGETFECYKYSWTWEDTFWQTIDHYSIYVCPGMGMIKMDESFEKPDNPQYSAKNIYTLISYKLKN